MKYSYILFAGHWFRKKRPSYTHCRDPGSEQAMWDLCMQYNIINYVHAKCNPIFNAYCTKPFSLRFVQPGHQIIKCSCRLQAFYTSSCIFFYMSWLLFLPYSYFQFHFTYMCTIATLSSVHFQYCFTKSI